MDPQSRSPHYRPCTKTRALKSPHKQGIRVYDYGVWAPYLEPMHADLGSLKGVGISTDACSCGADGGLGHFVASPKSTNPL